MGLSDIITQHGIWALGFAFAGMFIAGFTKGAVGFALPMIAISSVGSALSGPLAVAALILPSLVTNIWQTFRQGKGAAWASLRRFWLLNLVMFTMIAITAQLLVLIPDWLLFTLLGVVVTSFGAIQLIGWVPVLPKKGRKLIEALVGLVSGFFGGLSGVWGPPILLYFVALNLPKKEQVRAQGVSFLLGTFVLVGAHLNSGLLLGSGGVLSLWMIVPTFIGMALGLAVQDRLDQKKFRRLTLFVLVIAGLNLLRRAYTLF